MKSIITTVLATTLVLAVLSPAAADEPGESWAMAYGGRLYDSWWEALGSDRPDKRHPAYPASGRLGGADTWRCVACHGWDYKGRNGERATADPAVTTGGLSGMAGVDPKTIAGKIRAAPHGFSAAQIPDDALMTLAAFVSEGQHDLSAFVSESGRAIGNAERGRSAYEGICASCHQIDGMAFISAEDGDRPSLGWVSRHKPAQAIHKIRNGQPGADMVSIRFMDNAAVADLFAYIQGLDPASD